MFKLYRTRLCLLEKKGGIGNSYIKLIEPAHKDKYCVFSLIYGSYVVYTYIKSYMFIRHESRNKLTRKIKMTHGGRKEAEGELFGT